MKTVIIIILGLIITGLYYFPDTTKVVVKTTGRITYDVSSAAIDEIKTNDEVHGLVAGTTLFRSVQAAKNESKKRP
jgi:hypothetical protein